MPPQQPPQTRGTVTKCPCPYCGKPNSFKEEFDTGLLDKEAEFECDHCGNIMRVANVQPVTIVWLYQSPRNAQIKARRAQQGR